MCLIVNFVLDVYPKQSEEEFVEELMKWQTTRIYVGGFNSLIKKIKSIW